MKDSKQDLKPILISSPVRRSGTTLLQRLLCSAPNSLIYGESCANEMNMSVNLFQSKQLQLQTNQGWRDDMLKKVLAGDVNDWIADLMPEMAGYQLALEEAYLSILHHYKNFAAEQGRPIWGVKMAEWNLNMLVQIHHLLPESRLIYIHRELEACVRSAKRVNMVQGLAEIQQFALLRRQGIELVQQHIAPERLLLLSYEELLAKPAEQIERLEAFSGARSIDAKVLSHRINTFKSDLHRDPSGKGWLAPGELDEEELALVKTLA